MDCPCPETWASWKTQPTAFCFPGKMWVDIFTGRWHVHCYMCPCVAWISPKDAKRLPDKKNCLSKEMPDIFAGVNTRVYGTFLKRYHDDVIQDKKNGIQLWLLLWSCCPDYHRRYMKSSFAWNPRGNRCFFFLSIAYWSFRLDYRRGSKCLIFDHIVLDHPVYTCFLRFGIKKTYIFFSETYSLIQSSHIDMIIYQVPVFVYPPVLSQPSRVPRIWVALADSGGRVQYLRRWLETVSWLLCDAVCIYFSTLEKMRGHI